MPSAPALLVAAAIALGALIGPTAAGADTIAVVPDVMRATLPCTTDTPCTLDYGMSAAGAGDTVVLAGGTYTLSGFVQQNFGALRPAAGAHPVIVGEGYLNFGGTDISDLVVRITGSGGFPGVNLSGDAVADRLTVDHTADDSTAVEVADSATLRDSVAVEHGAGSSAVEIGGSLTSPTAYVENVTAIATGTGSIGIDVHSPAGTELCYHYPVTGQIRNAIARGTTVDIRAETNGTDTCNAPATADIATSNFRTADSVLNPLGSLVLGAGNQTDPAQTADAAVFADGAYHEQPDGPTVDAGLADPQTGSTDLDGDARVIDGRPDIGADEMIARPIVTTGAASLLGPTSGTLFGTAAAGPGSTLTGVAFDLGPSAAYAARVPALAGGTAWSTTAGGIAVGTLLHYRAVATATNGVQTRTATGADATLLFPIPPQPSPKPAPLRKLTAATVIKLTAPSNTCSSRRTLTLRFAAPKGAKIVKATIQLRGKTTTYKGKTLKPRIDLRGLPKGSFSVRVAITLADGRTAKLTKTYRTCHAKHVKRRH